MSERQRLIAWILGVGLLVIAADALIPGVHAIVMALLLWCLAALALTVPFVALCALARARGRDE